MPQTKRPKLPIILLSGFLGSGKTTTLQHLLENTEGIKIAVIVNDVASVNIDAKLVAATQSNGVMELRNGCACCSLADELLDSVSSLLGSDRTFDALVVEMSGVGDPIAIRSNWNAAKARGHPVTAKADVSQVVTLIDASTFGTDWMTWDLAAEREGWVERGDDCAGERKVPELLAEQVEAADLILINKVDIAGDNVAVATSLARELNDKAIIKQVQYGKVSPSLILQGLQPEAESKKNVKTPPRVSRVQKTSTNDLGITSFVYKANRPFNMRKLMAELNTWPVPMKDILDLDLLKEAQEGGYEIEGQTKEPSPFTGVLRSKGFCWFAPTKWAGQNADAYR
jgi:G3E family GTPase